MCRRRCTQEATRKRILRNQIQKNKIKRSLNKDSVGQTNDGPPLNVNTRIIRVRERERNLVHEGAFFLGEGGSHCCTHTTERATHTHTRKSNGEVDMGPLIGSGRRHYSLPLSVSINPSTICCVCVCVCVALSS